MFISCVHGAEASKAWIMRFKSTHTPNVTDTQGGSWSPAERNDTIWFTNSTKSIKLHWNGLSCSSIHSLLHSALKWDSSKLLTFTREDSNSVSGLHMVKIIQLCRWRRCPVQRGIWVESANNQRGAMVSGTVHLSIRLWGSSRTTYQPSSSEASVKCRSHSAYQPSSSDAPVKRRHHSFHVPRSTQCMTEFCQRAQPFVANTFVTWF